MGRSLAWARFASVWRFEFAQQWREPLTTLYLLIFLLLSLGYASGGGVELVSDRGDAPRTSAWALMLAFGGLTAFGQVITTMITATAMLRDEALRVRALIATTGLDARTWYAARVSAALTVMCVVYAGMPVGVIAGTALSGGDVRDAVVYGLRSYVVITIPTMLVVTVLLATAAAFTQRVLGVLCAALVMVGLWQLSLALVPHAHTRLVGAVLDPFGNAPVLATTFQWTDAQRASMLPPLGGVLLVNRLVWLLIATGVAGVSVWRGRSRFFALAPVRAAAPDVRRAVAHAGVAAASSTRASLRAFTTAWMLRDGGWRAVAVLAVLNAMVNALARPLPPSAAPHAAALLLASEHARLFLILLATVYAGELVWRERDVRVDALVRAMPVTRGDVVFGRLAGLLRAQLSVVLPLSLLALAAAVWRAGAPTHGVVHAVLIPWLAWTVFVLWLPFALLTVLSLAVHVLLDHKVAAHLLLITGWVVAVTIDRQFATPWWVRFAEPAPLMQGDAVQWGLLAQRGACWMLAGAALVWWCWWRWPGMNAGRAAVTSR